MKKGMQRLLVGTAAGAFLTTAESESVTPVEKVIKLLEDLKKTVEAEGKEEATTYDKFACFCKDTTKSKSKSITEAQDQIDSNTADIGSKSATKQEKITKRGQEQQKIEETSLKLQATTESYQKEKTAYEATKADLIKALSSVKKALKALKDSKGASLLSMGDKSDVQTALDLADALNLVEPAKQQSVSAFLQRVDPKDPAYKFHSAKIIEIIENLQKDFKQKKDDVMSEWQKTDKAYKAEKKQMEENIETAKSEIKKLTGGIDKLSSEIAKHKEDVVNAQSTLQDDSVYLKDLTHRCEEKAQDWDQRSKTRNDEVNALSEALKILTGKVKDADKVNKRAMLISKEAPQKSSVPTAKTKTETSKSAEASAEKKVQGKAKSFLEAGATTRGFLSKISRVQSLATAGRDGAIDLLHHEGVRLNSVVLSALARQIQSDPFDKIKKLIQGLIERLLNESRQEATKKGFCDTELGKSHQTRDTRYTEINKIDAEVASLEAHKDALEAEIAELTSNVADLKKDLKKATDLRKDEKDENETTVKTAKGGAKAVADALVTLKEFYKSSAKAASFAQASASPVDEDSPGAGFSGSYKGSQDSSKAIIGLLETIQSDFERTVRKTEADEEKAHDEFIEFDRTSKADIAGKETKVELDKQDLESTKNGIDQSMKDLETASKLLDNALKNIEELKPTCIDTGMSYSERVKKREEEIAALKKAMCMLDGNKVEAECQ